MKNLILLLFIAFSLTTSFYYPQRQEIKFVKRIFDLNKKNEKAQFDNWVTINLSNNSFDSIGKQYESKKVLKVSNKVSYPCFYEDERFEVYRKCNGEFGGALFFKSKRTRKLHVLYCTCAVQVEYKNGGYFIVESMDHMIGTTCVFEIKDPTTLLSVSPKQIETRVYGSSQFNNNIKRNLLLQDTFNLYVSMLYQYKNHDFVIFTPHGNLCIGELINGKISNSDTLLNQWLAIGRTTVKNDFHINESKSIGGYYSHDLKYLTQKTTTGKIFVRNDTIIIGYSVNVETIKQK